MMSGVVEARCRREAEGLTSASAEIWKGTRENDLSKGTEFRVSRQQRWMAYCINEGVRGASQAQAGFTN
jgi:hypothetical protein